MRYSKVISTVAIGAVTGVMLSATVANATIWDVVAVLSGSSGGFGFSAFHDARPPVMSGSNLGAISDGTGAVFGSFNDATGEFAATLTANGSEFTLASFGTKVLNFGGGSDFLQGPAELNIDFGSSSITLGDGSFLTTAVLGFRGTDVCCNGGDSDPNSFNIASNGLTAIMTLWGANGFDGEDAYDGTSTLGMDLRLSFNRDPSQIGVVPLPAALPLYGTGLALMGFVGWRRKRKAAA